MRSQQLTSGCRSVRVQVCRCCKEPSTENESQEIEMAGRQGNQTPSELQSEWDGSERDATEPAEGERMLVAAVV